MTTREDNDDNYDDHNDVDNGDIRGSECSNSCHCCLVKDGTAGLSHFISH